MPAKGPKYFGLNCLFLYKIKRVNWDQEYWNCNAVSLFHDHRLKITHKAKCQFSVQIFQASGFAYWKYFLSHTTTLCISLTKHLFYAVNVSKHYSNMFQPYIFRLSGWHHQDWILVCVILMHQLHVVIYWCVCVCVCIYIYMKLVH
jgi:hypothetical protein